MVNESEFMINPVTNGKRNVAIRFAKMALLLEDITLGLVSFQSDSNRGRVNT